jgi:hypothetical protein
MSIIGRNGRLRQPSPSIAANSITIFFPVKPSEPISVINAISSFGRC